jgi:hypothetical protein
VPPFVKTSSAAPGGPARNRSFFFGSYEGLRLQRSLTRTFSVPTAAERAGNFATSATICDPLTIPTAGVCTPFQGNQIPAGRIDPLAAALLGLVPLPTADQGPQNLTAVEDQDRTLNQFSLRLDHRLGARSAVHRFSTFDEQTALRTSALQEALVPGLAVRSRQPRNVVASHHARSGPWLQRTASWLDERGRRANQPESRESIRE